MPAGSFLTGKSIYCLKAAFRIIISKTSYTQRMSRILYIFAVLLCCSNLAICQSKVGPLSGKVICVDPGHGGTALTDHYRVGLAGEREEWVNLRVGLLLQKMLEEKGAKVIMTRTKDTIVTLPARAKLAVDNKADLFVSIHHNATADTSVNFPIIYFHGNDSENMASVAFGRLLAKNLVKTLYKNKVSRKGNYVSLVSDFTVFAEAGASVLRNSYGIPAVLAEASFFTNTSEEQKLKQADHNRDEAMAYTAAMELFFAKTIPQIEPKNSKVPVIPPFKVFQEAERMTPIAKRWYQDFTEANQLIARKDTASLRQAYDLYTRSAGSFPDSYVAATCHLRRSELLKLMGKPDESAQEAQRWREYYVVISEK
jgi:N-acetylmuramoyl-L-alanine amidase